MALLDSEIARIKYELNFNLLSVGAEPYIGVAAIFSQVIQPFLGGGATTTSSTVVVAASTPTPVTITLASGTGFTAGARVVIDVDDRQDVVTAQSVTGASLVVALSNAHTGTYPVTVEGGESIIREILTAIRNVKNQMGSLASSSSISAGTGGLKRVDDVEFHPLSSSASSSSTTAFGELGAQLVFWRNELASALGLGGSRGGAQRCAIY